MVQDSQDSKFPKELGEGILRNFSRTLALLQPCYPCFRKMKKWREHGHSPDLSDGSNSGVRVLGEPVPRSGVRRNIVKITLPTEMDAISTEVMHTIQAGLLVPCPSWNPPAHPRR